MNTRKSKKQEFATLETLFTLYPVEFSTAVKNPENTDLTITFSTLEKYEFMYLGKDLMKLSVSGFNLDFQNQCISLISIRPNKLLDALYDEMQLLGKKYRSTIHSVLQEQSPEMSDIIADYVVSPYDKEMQLLRKSYRSTIDSTLPNHPSAVNDIISDYVIGTYDRNPKKEPFLSATPQSLFYAKSTTDLSLTEQLGFDKKISFDSRKFI